MLNFFLLILGFALLIFGANWLVDGASSLAKKYHIPNIVIGLTIVAFGTSAPELVVNVFASVNQNSDIALGNVIGSNIFNVLAILGISAIIFPLAVKSGTTWIEIPLCFLSSVIVLLLANDMLIDGASISELSRTDGLVFLCFFIIFIVYNFQLMKKGDSAADEMQIKNWSALKSTLFIALGLAALIIGGRTIVIAASSLARTIGISERIIALTVVSIGTSAPELATSVVAALKKNVDIAIGNIVGSNIFNVFLILGISATIYPVSVHPNSNFDLLVNVMISLMLFVFIFTGKKRQIERWEGVLFVSLYIIYLIAVIRWG